MADSLYADAQGRLIAPLNASPQPKCLCFGERYRVITREDALSHSDAGFLDYTRNFITCLPGVPLPAIFVEQIDLAAYLIPHQFHIPATSRETINDSYFRLQLPAM